LQKEFTENASHELQTPLAVIQSKLDMLLQLPELNEKQSQIVQSLYTVSKRMSHLNKNLLLLSKIDNNQYEEKESVNVTTTVDMCFKH
jgi:signal transduction histidine kinase